VPGLMEHACNLNTWDPEAGGSWVQVQSGLHNNTLAQKIKAKANKAQNKTKQKQKKESRLIYW
jgi:hypothetical protein